jgi:hypothetical protein
MRTVSEQKKGMTAEEEVFRTVNRWISLSELVVPRWMKRDRGVPRAADTVGRKGGERERDPEGDRGAEL